MLSFAIKKIKNRIMLTFCIVIGIAFLSGCFFCMPMLFQGVLDVSIGRSFEQSTINNNCYPTILKREAKCEVRKNASAAAVEESIAAYKGIWRRYLSDIDIAEERTSMTLPILVGRGEFNDKKVDVKLAQLDNLINNCEIVDGDITSFGKILDHNVLIYPCIISERLMDKYGLVVGEILDLKQNNISLKVVAVFKPKTDKSEYWCMDFDELMDYVYVGKENFNIIADKVSVEEISYTYYQLLDYGDINAKNISDISYYLDEFSKKDDCFNYSFKNEIREYRANKTKAMVFIFVFAIPVIIISIVYITMLAAQLSDAEMNDIMLLKSRGISTRKITGVYFLYAALVAAMGYLIGIPFGILLCHIAGNTTGFLQFDRNYIIAYSVNLYAFLLGFLISIVAIIFIMVPIVKCIRCDNQKTSPKVKRNLLQSGFVEIIILLVSLYLMYNYYEAFENIRANILKNNNLDPMIFVDVTIFIIAGGLFILKISALFIRSIYRLFGKYFKAEAYAAFLGIIRGEKKLRLISVFLILTIAMGVFNTNIADSILTNNENRIVYESGGEIKLKEEFAKKIVRDKLDNTNVIQYVEPDYGRYSELADIMQNTRVVTREDAIVSVSGGKIEGVRFQAIHTKEFGEIAYLDDSFNQDTHWYHYLNSLSQDRNGVIISRNLADACKVTVGDSIDISLERLEDNIDKNKAGHLKGKVCAIVDNWPGYKKYSYENGEEKQDYLVVINYATSVEKFKILPYEVWIKLKSDISKKELERRLFDKDISPVYLKYTTDNIEAMKSSSNIQITNGMLTLGFLIMSMLSFLGYVIYWILTIKKREHYFGMYLAMGMGIKQLKRMLIMENFLGTMLAIFSGLLVGEIATVLFSKLYLLAYLPEKHNVGIKMYIGISGSIKLIMVLLFMILFTILCIENGLKKMKVTQAIKLGEDLHE